MFFEVKMKGETLLAEMERKDQDLDRENFITALRFIVENLEHFL